MIMNTASFKGNADWWKTLKRQLKLFPYFPTQDIKKHNHIKATYL